MKTEYIIIIVCAAAVFLLLIGFLIYKLGSKNRKSAQKVGKVKVKDGVRYTKDDSVIVSGDVNITHNEGDIILERGREYTVRKGGRIMPGKYTVLAADGASDGFNVRIGGYVRELKHNTSIVLSEGDKICSVSHTTLLR